MTSTTTQVSQTLQLESITLLESSIERPPNHSGVYPSTRLLIKSNSISDTQLFESTWGLASGCWEAREAENRVLPSETRSAYEYRNHRGRSGWGTAFLPTFQSTVSILHSSVPKNEQAPPVTQRTLPAPIGASEGNKAIGGIVRCLVHPLCDWNN